MRVTRGSSLLFGLLPVITLLAFVAGGCGDSGRSASEKRTAAETEKLGSGVRARLVEPERYVPGAEHRFVLELEGAPGERFEVQLFGSEGVTPSRYDQPTGVTLDGSGKAELEFTVATPDAPGCYLFAHITAADGRVRELRCVLGAPPEESRKPREVRGPSDAEGRRVLIEPSREARER